MSAASDHPELRAAPRQAVTGQTSQRAPRARNEPARQNRPASFAEGKGACMRYSAVIVDPNGVVAGLVIGNGERHFARRTHLDGMPAAAFPYVISAALLAGYCAVRLRARRDHGH